MTQRGFVTEILNVHADRLQEGSIRSSRQYLRMFPDYAASLEPLMSLAERLQADLQQPVRPGSRFRRRLRQELVAAALDASARPGLRPFWLERRTAFSMAAGGAALAVTVAGVAAWLLRHRLPMA